MYNMSNVTVTKQDEEKKESGKTDHKVLDTAKDKAVPKDANTPENQIEDLTNKVAELEAARDVAIKERDSASKELEDTNRQLTLKTRELVGVIDALEDFSGNLSITGGQLINVSRVLKGNNEEAYAAYVVDKHTRMKTNKANANIEAPPNS